MKPLSIAFFGSSLVSAYWDSSAAYHRGVVRALGDRGHRVTFYEPDARERQRHCDVTPPPAAKIRRYPAQKEALLRALEEATDADLVIKASSIGVLDGLLEEAILELKTPTRLVAFWDVDPPATLARLAAAPDDPFRTCIPRYDLVLTCGGGAPVVERYTRLGARRCIPIYNAIDPAGHRPVPRDPRFAADVSFLGNRQLDVEARVSALFVDAARLLPQRQFLLGGAAWDGEAFPPNIDRAGHVHTRDQDAFHCSADVVLDISRESMAETGFSPSTRFFEAAGVGACVITDDWEGVEAFLEPGRQVLVAASADEVARNVTSTSLSHRRAIGEAARRRILTEHTYARRVRLLEQVLDGRVSYREAS